MWGGNKAVGGEGGKRETSFMLASLLIMEPTHETEHLDMAPEDVREQLTYDGGSCHLIVFAYMQRSDCQY